MLSQKIWHDISSKIASKFSVSSILPPFEWNIECLVCEKTKKRITYILSTVCTTEKVSLCIIQLQVDV